MWVYVSSNLLMDFLTFITAMTNLSSIFLGLTLLSLGNSLNDYFVDGALAAKGLELMAVTGIFSG
jgi:Ca2+/Na+ antiporter